MRLSDRSPHPGPRSSARGGGRRTGRLRRALDGVRRTVLLRRRPLAVVLAVVAVLTGLRAATTPPEPTTGVVVASRDLPGGAPLTDADLERRALPVDGVPDGSTSDPRTLLGRTLAAPVREGEPVTDVRVVADGLLSGYPSLVAAPVRIADAGSVRLLRVGDRVDVVATDPANGRAEVATEAAPVVALPRGTRTGEGSSPLSGGALVVLAVPRSTAVALAGSAATDLLSVLLSE